MRTRNSLQSARTFRGVALLAKLAAAVLATFLLVELLLIAFDDVFFGRSFYGFDPDIGFRVRPYARYGRYEANEFGFNDRDYPHERVPGTFRILVLGDSFNWTFGPDRNYAGILERLLREAEPAAGTEVINAGYPQTHTGQELAVLRKFAMQYLPDLVVLGFFVGNDFYDADPRRRRIVVGGTATDIRPGRDFYRVAFGRPLVWRSRLALFLGERWKELQLLDEGRREQFTQTPSVDHVRGADPPGSYRTRSRPPTLDSYLSWLARRMEFARPSNADAYRASEHQVYGSLLAMRDLLSQRGAGFLVAVYPDSVQVDPAVRRALLERTGRAASDYEWTRPQRLLRTFCAKHDIPVVDLLAGFRDARKQGWSLYLDNDSHWNAAGNVLAAELLSEALLPQIREAMHPPRAGP